MTSQTPIPEDQLPSETPEGRKIFGLQVDIGSNLGKLTSVLDGLQGEQRLAGIVIVLAVISLAVIAQLPPENQPSALVFMVSIAIIGLLSVYIYRRQDLFGKRIDHRLAQRDESKKLTILVYHSGNTTNIVNKARVIVSNVDKPDDGTTGKYGTWEYTYPSYYIEQNQIINVRAEKDGVGVGRREIKITGQNQPEPIELLSENAQPVNSEYIDHTKSASTIIRKDPISELMTPEERKSLTDLLTRSGLVDGNRRKAFCLRIGVNAQTLSTSPENLNITAFDFATLLLDEIENKRQKQTLSRICQELEPIYETSEFRSLLESIRSNFQTK